MKLKADVVLMLRVDIKFTGSITYIIVTLLHVRVQLTYLTTHLHQKQLEVVTAAVMMMCMWTSSHAPLYICTYCLTKISMRAKRSISRVFSLFIVPSPFLYIARTKGRIDRAERVLTGPKPY